MTQQLCPNERNALAAHIEEYAEGVQENLEDNNWPGQSPAMFPVVEDMLNDADRVRAGELSAVNPDTLEAVADMDPEGVDALTRSALETLGYKVGYR